MEKGGSLLNSLFSFEPKPLLQMDLEKENIAFTEISAHSDDFISSALHQKIEIWMTIKMMLLSPQTKPILVLLY